MQAGRCQQGRAPSGVGANERPASSGPCRSAPPVACLTPTPRGAPPTARWRRHRHRRSRGAPCLARAPGPRPASRSCCGRRPTSGSSPPRSTVAWRSSAPPRTRTARAYRATCARPRRCGAGGGPPAAARLGTPRPPSAPPALGPLKAPSSRGVCLGDCTAALPQPPARANHAHAPARAGRSSTTASARSCQRARSPTAWPPQSLTSARPRPSTCDGAARNGMRARPPS